MNTVEPPTRLQRGKFLANQEAMSLDTVRALLCRCRQNEGTEREERNRSITRVFVSRVV